MIKRWLMCFAVLMLGLVWMLPGAATAASDIECSGEIAVCSIAQERVLRFCGTSADLSDLGADEFYSYVLHFRYNGAKTRSIRSFYVRVDGGEKWYWGTTQFNPGDNYTSHIYYVNMRNIMTPGTHEVVWYVDDQPIQRCTFTLTSPTNWYSRFAMPTADQIAQANRTATVRSPYLLGWLKIPESFRYTEISADFKADFVPKATYCSLMNLKIDLSPLKKMYKSVRNDYGQLNLYAGFQRRWSEYATIMSLWDIYCTDKNGVEHTIHPKRVYPEEIKIGDGSFTGEGDGTQLLIPFEWEAGHWYRMLLQCRTSDAGTTTVEQWVCDLETGAWTLVSICDTGIPNTCFIGENAFFLENFDPRYAGDVRAMEVCNVRVRAADTGSWQGILTATLASDSGMPNYSGSYAYGTDDDCFWMITSGVGGDWFGTNKVPQNWKNFTVKNGLATSPY